MNCRDIFGRDNQAVRGRSDILGSRTVNQGQIQDFERGGLGRLVPSPQPSLGAEPVMGG